MLRGRAGIRGRGAYAYRNIVTLKKMFDHCNKHSVYIIKCERA